MFFFDNPLSTGDLAALGGLLFLMVTGRMLKDETRVATYGVIAAVMTGEPATLFIVPLLAFTIKLIRVI